jgi:DNA-binding GntR family transcriptional regulator
MLTGNVTARLRRMILDSELQPGEHLPEGKLAGLLGASRQPVREAIRILDSEGFVNISPRRGAFVAVLAADSAENLFDVRMALEPLAAQRAARNCSADGLELLDGIVKKATEVASEDGLGGLTKLNTEFHIAIYELAANPYLLAIGTQTMQRSQWVFQYPEAAAPTIEWFIREHGSIRDAIGAGDEVLAGAEALRHVAGARMRFRKFQDERQRRGH